MPAAAIGPDYCVYERESNHVAKHKTKTSGIVAVSLQQQIWHGI